MPVYNTGKYVEDAVRSILEQSFGDFEFIIVDDGSTDDSVARIRRFSDPRIRLIEMGENVGIVGALNAGLSAARGRYIARMDADDISHRLRFEKQLRFLAAYPDIGILGTGWTFFGSRDGGDHFRSTPALLKASLLFGAPFSHPTVMFHRQIMLDHGLTYDPAFGAAEDYELWARFARVTNLANLRAPHLAQRIHPGSVSHVQRERQRDAAMRTRNGIIDWIGAAGPARTADYALHERIAAVLNAPEADQLAEPLPLADVERWFRRLLEANARTGAVDQAALQSLLAEKWYKLCRNLFERGDTAARDAFFTSSLARRSDHLRWHVRRVRAGVARRGTLAADRVRPGR